MPGDPPQAMFQPNPFSMGNARTLEVAPGSTLQEIVDKADLSQRLMPYVEVLINEHVVPRENWSLVRPKSGTYIYVRLRPGGNDFKNVLRVVLMLAIIVVAVAITIVAPELGLQVWGAATALLGLVNALIPPPKPKSEFSFDQQPGNPYGQITGLRNQAAPWGPIPRVIGKRRMYPMLAARPYTETVGSDQYLRMLLVVGYGPCEITQLKIGENLITNIDQAQYEIREGWYGVSGHANDTPVTLFQKDIQEDGFAILMDTSGISSIQTTRANTKEISVDLSMPAGWIRFGDHGGENEVIADFTVEYRVAGSGGGWTNAAWLQGSAQYGTDVNGRLRVKDKTQNGTRRSGRWAVTPGQYEVRITRNTAHINDNRTTDVAYWTTLRSIVDSTPLPMNGLCLIAVRLKATAQLNGVPDVINCIAESYIPIYSGGVWTYTKTSNPAWHYADVLRRRGQDVIMADSRIDLTTIAAWATACATTAPNASEPYWSSNAVLEGGSIYTNLQAIAANGRASPTIKDGKYSVVQDVVQSNPVQHFTPRNSWNYRGSKVFVDVPHCLRVQFINAAKGYAQDEIRVFQDGYNADGSSGLIAASKYEILELPLCTSSTQAWREGRYHLAVMILRPEQHSVDVDVENLRCQIGDRVQLTHDVISVGQGSGRILSRTTSGGNVTTVTLDNPVNMSAGMNSLLRSNDFLIVWGGLATAAQTGPSYDGVVQSWKLSDVSGAASQGKTQSYTVPNDSVTRTASIRVAKTSGGTSPTFGLQMAYSGGTPVSVMGRLNTDTGATGGGATSIDNGDGTWTLSVSLANNSTGNTSLQIGLYPAINTYNNLGADSVAATGTAICYGAQSETGATAQTYTATTSAAKSARSYALRVRKADFSSILVPVNNVPGTGVATLTLTTPTLIANAPDVGDLFAFGESGLESAPMIVKAIKPQENLEATVLMTNYDAGIYTSDTGTIPAFTSYITTPTKDAQRTPPDVDFDLVSDFTTALYGQDGTTIERIGVVIKALPSGSDVLISQIEIQWRPFLSAQYTPHTILRPDNFVTYITGVRAGSSYYVRCRSLSATGMPGQWIEKSIQCEGKAFPPGDLTSFAATTTLVGQIGLSWVLPNDGDLWHVELYRHTSAALAYATGTLTFAGVPAANDTFTIKGIAVTWVASGADGYQINIGANANACAAAVKAFIDGKPDTFGVTATVVTNVVTFKALQPGTIGNAITLAESGANTSVSGANLTGGVGTFLTAVADPGVAYVDAGVTAGNAYYWARAVDLSGNYSNFTSAFNVGTLGTAVDLSTVATPPTSLYPSGTVLLDTDAAGPWTITTPAVALNVKIELTGAGGMGGNGAQATKGQPTYGDGGSGAEARTKNSLAVNNTVLAGVVGDPNSRVAANRDTKITTGYTLTAAGGGDATDLTKASATVVFAGVAAAGNTVVVNGTTFTYVNSGASGLQVNVGSTAADSAANLASVIHANTGTCGCDAGSGSNVVTIYYNTAGTGGNGITLTRTGANISVSGNLAGGTVLAQGTHRTGSGTADTVVAGTDGGATNFWDGGGCNGSGNQTVVASAGLPYGGGSSGGQGYGTYPGAKGRVKITVV